MLEDNGIDPEVKMLQNFFLPSARGWRRTMNGEGDHSTPQKGLVRPIIWPIGFGGDSQIDWR